jgi:hypothetical protein
LEEEHAHPDNRGWMNLFRHWSWSGMFRVTWAVCVATYGARFQQFCRRQLGLESGELTLGASVMVGSEGWENCINFLEVEHIHRIIAGEYVESPDTLESLNKDRIAEHANNWIRSHNNIRLLVQPLEMRVSDPFGKELDFVFPVGFALLEKSEDEKGSSPEYSLTYYRIQDHLRRMGLGRKGLRKLQEKYQGIYIDMPSGLTRIIREADPAQIQNLWHLVLWSNPAERGIDIGNG